MLFCRESWFRMGRTLAVGLLAFSSTVAPGWAVPAVQFSSPSVAVSQVTPGGAAVLVYAGHEPNGELRRRSVEFDLVSDFDGDGAVTHDTGSSLVTTSVWAVVDLMTGAVTVDAPNGYLPTEVNVDPAVITATPGSIEVEQQNLHLLLVRPGKRALHASAHDGATSDDGAADDGWVVLDLGTLKSVANGAGVRWNFSASSGDVLVGIDSEFLTYFVTTVP